MRLLRSPKWLFGHLLAAVTVVTFVSLGFWQLDRLDQARAHNDLVEQRMDAPPVTLEETLDEDAAYRHVLVSGRYLADQQALSAPRARDGAPGHHVLTPLQTSAGTVLVDRGWVPFDREGPDPGAVSPPEGEVEIAGLLLPSEDFDVGEAEEFLAIDPEAIGERAGLAMLPDYVQLVDQVPATEGGPLAHAEPVIDEGNHFSYAVQWFLFTGVVAIGYPLLLRHTVRSRRDEESAGETSARPGVPSGV